MNLSRKLFVQESWAIQSTGKRSISLVKRLFKVDNATQQFTISNGCLCLADVSSLTANAKSESVPIKFWSMTYKLVLSK